MRCLTIPALTQTECSNQRSNDSTDEADDREPCNTFGVESVGSDLVACFLDKVFSISSRT